MGDTVLISTHRLELAGLLRTAFGEAGYGVDLVTPDERLTGRDDAALLVLTGGTATDVRALAAQARDRLHVPILRILSADCPADRRVTEGLGAVETFDPSVSPDDVLLIGRQEIERRRLQQATGIVGQSDGIRQALERVVQIAPVDSTVLVTGESGTGKELIARGIHALSPRKHKRFIAVNVAALPETLLESELFGHEKGAFTGAIDSRRGFFELADKGTIFLDEIGEMPLATQTKLLRVLESREFMRVGAESPTRVDVRIIAATNQDLRQLVAIGDFRKDLFYRLNVLSIELPPLRERSDDVPLLVDEFIREISDRHDRPFVGISSEAMQILKDHNWPGNVRELRNLVESMVVLAPGREIRPEDIPKEVRYPAAERRLLPTRVPPPGLPAKRETPPAPTVRPELEFIFRTLVELRVDMDELRQEFEAYRQERIESGLRHHEGLHPLAREIRVETRSGEPVEIVAVPTDSGNGEPRIEELQESEAASEPEPGVIVYEPGMTMDDLERLAIQAALRHNDGNRRKAAKELGIGERTLYRKIQKYELDV
jgi:transcriptional regulator with PAS, ATPase and Fis domain